MLDALHRVAVVGVGLVPLEHRELGLVLVGDALVSEILADLVDPLEPPDDQPLQIELGGDSQIQVDVQLVVMCDEGLCEGAAVRWLQDRCLNLHEAVFVEPAADRRDQLASKQEVAPGLLVDQQVEVALPVPRLRIHQPVEGVR